MSNECFSITITKVADEPLPEQCDRCRYYRHGYCLRNPPSTKNSDNDLTGVWPTVTRSDWCGEFKWGAP